MEDGRNSFREPGIMDHKTLMMHDYKSPLELVNAISEQRDRLWNELRFLCSTGAIKEDYLMHVEELLSEPKFHRSTNYTDL